jgi:integrase
MPKKAPELSAADIRRLSHGYVQGKHRDHQPVKNKTGTPCTALHAVGGVSGLLLQCSPPLVAGTEGARSWVLRVKIGDKRRDIGLGGFPDVSLSQARETARIKKEEIRQGIDPVIQRKSLRSATIREQERAVTFKELAKVYIRRKSKEYKDVSSLKQTQKLTQQITSYALPYIGNMIVSDIEMSHVVKMLTPIWETKTETATRVRLHVEKILDIAIADKKRSGVNPARWKGMLEHSSLPAPGKVSKVTHHAALPVGDMPAFWQKLRQAKGTGARTLQFIILTACRSGEARGATWEEVDFDNKTWTIPAERMKAAKDHVIPLTDEAVKLLEDTPRLGKYLFTGGRGGQISDVMVSKVPKILGHDVTAHGFRSTFKDWSRLHTAYPDEVSELQLAHVNNDATRAAYARDGLLNKRRLLMQDWEQYCYHGHKEKSGNVVAIGGGRV